MEENVIVTPGVDETTEEVTTEEKIEESEGQLEDELGTGESEEGEAEGQETEETEFFETDADYFKSVGLDEFESMDQIKKALQQGKDDAAERDRLKYENEYSRPEEKRLGVSQVPPDGEGQIFNRGIMTTHINSLANTGQIDNDRLQAQRGTASAIDTALDPLIGKFEQAIYTLDQQNQVLIQHIRNTSWETFPHKSLISRRALDQLMNGQNLLSYDAGAIEYAKNQPDLLRRLTEKAEQRGETKGRRHRYKKQSSMKRGQKGKPAATRSFAPYQDPEGNLDMTRVKQLPIEQRLKVMKDYKQTYEAENKRG